MHSGQIIYDEITVNQETTPNRFLQAKESTTPNIFFQTITNRTFTDVLLATQEDINSIVSGSVYKGSYDADQDLPTLPTGSDVLGDTYRVSVSGGVYEVGDLLIYNGATYDHIPVQAVTQEALAQGGLSIYDWYVKPTFVGSVTDGKAHTPYTTIQQAVDASSEGDSIFLDGVDNIAAEIVLPHSLSFYGANNATIQYATYDASNGNIFSFEGNGTQEFTFEHITFKNAGEYALLIKKTDEVNIRNCEFFNNGWNGQGLHTVVDSATSGVLGYDSDTSRFTSVLCRF